MARAVIRGPRDHGTVIVGGYTTGALLDGQRNLGHRDMFILKADLR